MEIRAWRMSCCTPEALECRGCFRRLNGTTRKWTNRRQNRTQREGSDGGRDSRPEGSSRHAHRKGKTAGEEREGKRKGRKKRRGQMKQEYLAESYTKVLLPDHCILSLLLC